MASEPWDAYRRTSYIAGVNGRDIVIRVGAASAELDAELARRGARVWAFVSACNPMSAAIDESANAFRHGRLIRRVRDMGLAHVEGFGAGDQSDWPPERSLLIFRIKRAAAVQLGKAFGQQAVVLGELGGRAMLIECADGSDRSTPDSRQ